MAVSFTPKFLDDLSDNVLQYLNLLVQVAFQPDRGAKDQATIDQITEMIQHLDQSKFDVFRNDVKQAYERRFGSVPGY